MIWRRRSIQNLKKLLRLLYLFPGMKESQYYLEKKERLNKVHIFHKGNCDLLPEEAGRIGLGDIEDFEKVKLKAKMRYVRVEGCKYCISKETSKGPGPA